MYFGIFERNIEKITNGDYKTRMNNKNAGIFTSMIDNFNSMATELESRKFLNEDFVNNFSHEFKTPISSIKGFADLLLEDDVSKKDKNKYLHIISDEAYRLAQLSEKAIFLSKINIQTNIPDKINYSLDEQISKNLILLKRYIEEKKIKVNINLDKIIYKSNPDIINHIWLNLLSNAIKYSKDNGTIDLKLKIIGKNIIFTIKDNGIGIESDKQKHIFNEYYQADESHKGNGVGLGLSIVKKIVDLSNGTIEVFSELDKRTTFIVKLKN